MSEEGISKFKELKLEYKIVLPCCLGDCSKIAHSGWVLKGKKKSIAKSKKRKVISLNLDLKEWKPKPIGSTLEFLREWLDDSKPAWSQLVFTLKASKQIKKQRMRR